MLWAGMKDVGLSSVDEGRGENLQFLIVFHQEFEDPDDLCSESGE